MRHRPARRRLRAGWVVVAVSGVVLATSCGGGGPSVTETTPPGPGRSSAERAMQVVLDELRLDSSAPGVLAMVRRGGDEWFGASGAADLDGAPIVPTTRFRIGSISKTVTSALVLDAVARGELSLDDTIQSWVPGVVDDEPAITIRMLLAHTSGLFNAGDEGDVVSDIERISDPDLRQQAQDLGARYLAGERVIVPDVVLIALAKTHPLYFEPGRRPPLQQRQLPARRDGTRGRDRQGPRLAARGAAGRPLRPVSDHDRSRRSRCTGHAQLHEGSRHRTAPRHHHRPPRRRQRWQWRRHLDRRRAARPPAGDRRRRPAAGSAPGRDDDADPAVGGHLRAGHGQLRPQVRELLRARGSHRRHAHAGTGQS